ncbi:MAG: hypothetical protein U1A62_17940, partial [Pseudomonas sp.]|nr:hypothetical protein [Pseudomonas sp.]
MALAPFHLAIPVYDLAAARHFYGEVFGCAEGRSSAHWVDFDFFGHQLVIHQAPKMTYQEEAHSNPVDGHDVPVPHFGVVLGWDDWQVLAARLQAKGTQFVIEPYVRFAGQVLGQLFGIEAELPGMQLVDFQHVGAAQGADQ